MDIDNIIYHYLSFTIIVFFSVNYNKIYDFKEVYIFL